jgi:hypothetical protein
MIAPMSQQRMFEPNQGFGPAKWLPWLFVAAFVYAILTLIPGTEHMVAKIGAIGGAILFAALWKQIKGIFD